MAENGIEDNPVYIAIFEANSVAFISHLHIKVLFDKI